ncbi:FkbM family methyltransferase [Legionella bozemanae]|uniref:Chromosome partition protein Smc n=1 Tax=Legionella bozemanae TaxID=447 RepID=A0A0W0RSK8_LEGBO|nr:FkbM family methyltransferase [Legionella bozemanae]KTC74050.1 Chromosome partition protein Smc [Legionella bozemanae]STO33637.1 methyltransferase, FkbM family [Legionella bozemanae]
MNFVSYAQNFEDVMLWRALKHIKNGFYVDVGANDPTHDSVTRAFYEKGWAGINIEPVSEWFQKLKKERHRDINLQVAAGERQGEIFFYELPNTGLSTTNKAIAEKHEIEQGYTKIERKVPVMTLTEIICEHQIKQIHFLKIDVEGAEKKVLEGLDFAKIRPWIVLVESTLPNTQIEDFIEWETLLLNAEYDYVYFDGLNRFYIAKEHDDLSHHFKTPPNYFDGFLMSETQSFCRNMVNEKNQLKAEIIETIELKEYKSNAEKQIHSLTTWLTDARQEVEAYKTNADAQVQLLTTWLADARQEVEVLQKYKINADAQVHSLTTWLTDARQKVEVLEEYKTNADAQVQLLTTWLTDARQEVKVLEEYKINAEAQIQSLTAQLTEAQSLLSLPLIKIALKVINTCNNLFTKVQFFKGIKNEARK